MINGSLEINSFRYKYEIKKHGGTRISLLAIRHLVLVLNKMIIGLN